MRSRSFRQSSAPSILASGPSVLAQGLSDSCSDSRSSHPDIVTPVEGAPGIWRPDVFNPRAKEDGNDGPLVPSRNENMALRSRGCCFAEPPDMLGWSRCTDCFGSRQRRTCNEFIYKKDAGHAAIFSQTRVSSQCLIHLKVSSKEQPQPPHKKTL